MIYNKDSKEMRQLIDNTINAMKKNIKFLPKPKLVLPKTVLGKVILGEDSVYEYSKQNIDILIDPEIEHGNYRFGYIDSNNCFVVFYIGRADNGLQVRMHQHWYKYLNNEEFTKYKDKTIYFSYRYMESQADTYAVECEEYHIFDDGKNGNGDFLNIDHPSQPKGTDWHCQICGEPKN